MNGNPSVPGPLNTGETVSYSCSAGFVIQGTDTLTCRLDGTFSSQQPTCVPGKRNGFKTRSLCNSMDRQQSEINQAINPIKHSYKYTDFI